MKIKDYSLPIIPSFFIYSALRHVELQMKLILRAVRLRESEVRTLTNLLHSYHQGFVETQTLGRKLLIRSLSQFDWRCDIKKMVAVV